MINKEKGSATFEYTIILILIVIVALAGTFLYRKYFVSKGFQASTDALEFQDSNSSVDDFEETTSYMSNFKISTPLILAIFCGLILLGIVFSMLKAAGKAKRSIKEIRGDEDGQAMTEFVITFPLLLFITLCIMQLSLIYTARLVVNYSAFSAARAAIVIIPSIVGAEAEGSIDPEVDDGKLNIIRNAARLSCTPIAARASTVASSFYIAIAGHRIYPLQEIGDFLGGALNNIGDTLNSFFNAIGVHNGGKMATIAIDKYLYSYLFTQVQLLDDDFKKIESSTSYTTNPVTVRVVHSFRLGIPIANAFFGKKMGWDLYDQLGLDNFDFLGGAVDHNTASIGSGYVYSIHGDCTMHVAGKVSH